MKRYIRLCLLTLVLGVLSFMNVYSADEYLSGVIPVDSVRVLLKGTTYKMNQQLVIKGALIIEPGVEIKFYDNGRIIVAPSGRLIADGFATLSKKARPASIDNDSKILSQWPVQGYHDMRCFLFPISETNTSQAKTAGLGASEMTRRERTIHPSKYNHIFNVAIDTATRRIRNIANPSDGSWPVNDDASANGSYIAQHNRSNSSMANLIIVPYETALMFMAARMDEFPATDLQLKLNDWKRKDGSSPNIEPATINFVGQPQNNMSREWGHIVVLPGARAAFFRNCKFENIKKDTTVDNKPYFVNDDLNRNLNNVELVELNNEILKLTNGGGGAITTFSSRTWIVDCAFNKNFARNRGGAVQILQSPTSYFYPSGRIIAADTAGIERFNFDINNTKNIRVSDASGYTSVVMNRNSINYPRYPKIDKIDESTAEYFVSDASRIAWDDARLAGYLGRFRNLEFENNMVRLAKTAALKTPSGATLVQDDLDAKVTYPQTWGNMAYGGALYIAGTEDDSRQIEFTLGMNDSIRLGDNRTLQNPNNIGGRTGFKDYIKFNSNSAHNFQANKYSDGAKGGAIYVGKNTSLIVAGEFTNNYTDAKWLVDTTGLGTYNNGEPTPYTHGVLYSQGGAIYSHPLAYGRLQIRGDRDKDNIQKRTTNFGEERRSNSTKFVNNRAGAGGAVYVAESADVLMSPQIGGSDVTKALNNYGWRIEFNNNYAYSAGGAIYSKRNSEITGAGGARDDYQYSLAHLIRFNTNAAGFSGGAIHVEIPVGNDLTLLPNARIVNMRRVELRDNNVGEIAYNDDKNVNNKIVDQIRGGGAVYTLWADLNVIRAVNVIGNKVYNGNGAGIAMVNPYSKTERLFVTDLDAVNYAPLPAGSKEGTTKIATDYVSVNNPFTFGANYKDANANYVIEYPEESYSYFDGNTMLTEVLKSGAVSQPVVGMLNRFEDNQAIASETIGKHQIENYGNTQMSSGYVMPRASITSQWWFGPNQGFIATTMGNLVKVYKNAQSKIEWSEKYNDSLWHGHNFTDIHFISANTGYLADNYGMIHRTTDKGATWTTVLSLNSLVETITDIHFYQSTEKGLAVTTQGNIYKTTNGTDWTKVGSFNDKSLNGVCWGADGNTAYVVGSEGLIARSADAGLTWSNQSVPGLVSKNLDKVMFLNASRGFAIGDKGVMVTTTDGGLSWGIAIGAFPVGDRLTSIAFYGQSLGYLTTNSGSIYRTLDSGKTWGKLNQDFPRSINSIFIVDERNIFIAGANDLLYKTNDSGATWTLWHPYNQAGQLGNPRLHGAIPGLVENGVGLGGAIYILDFQNENNKARTDSIRFNRTRIIDNFAFTGSAIYSDNFNLKLLFNRSLIRGNKTDVNNTVGANQNGINGPFNKSADHVEKNYASSDLVSATIYGEIQGPFPSSNFSELANSIFENEARFLIRLPDAPNTKGVLAGLVSGVGNGGTDTLRGNYWGKTEANVGLSVLNLHKNHSGTNIAQDGFMTFFVEKRTNNGQILKADKNYLPFYNAQNGDLRRQGPFEYNSSDYQGTGTRNLYTYTYIDLNNADNTVADFEEIPADQTIPEKYLFSYDIYDLHDKGTDVKTADYTKRRMFPIEDFAVGNPFLLYVDHSDFVDANDLRTDQARKQKYVKRWVRNPEYANAVDAQNKPLYPALAALQRTWKPMLDESNVLVPKYYHPIGMPIYLETKARILVGDNSSTNRDLKHQSSTVFFVINESTQDFIRVELKQIPRKYGEQDSIWADDIFRATVFLVPDSTDRKEPQIRRHAENLLNLGSNGTYPFSTDPDYGAGGSGSPEMLRKICPRFSEGGVLNGIINAARNEDYAALGGRKYQVVSKGNRANYGLGAIGQIYSNRPTMPIENDYQGAGGLNESKNTYFAGERYGTLPANAGDVIRVVSRNVLWRQGITKAYDGGLVFIVKEGPEKPEFTGDIVMYDTPKLNPYVTDPTGAYPIYRGDRLDTLGQFGEDTVKNHGLLNKVFVQTNHQYPAEKGTYSKPELPANVRGTDVILSVTAIDRNNFYDPRTEMFADRYTSLIYRWGVLTPNSALKHWLMVDTVLNKTLNGAKGYLEFKGVPLNPYIVPGGEKIQVSARNYAPGIDLIDSLKAINATAEEIARYYQTFPPYLNAPYYNQNEKGEADTVARYLQQDTIGIHGNINVSKEITIFVMDSLPRFIAYKPVGSPLVPEQFKIKKAGAVENEYDYRDYSWTQYQAGLTLKDENQKVLVNVTDKLRFKMDLNTDDELEDLSAEEKNWDFRYGRTAYSFANLAISAKDTIVIDTLYGNKDKFRVVSQLKPSWMNDAKYFKKYDDINVADEFLTEFQRSGKMNIRIDSADAYELLKRSQALGRDVYNVDTMMAIVANNGHGGLSTQFVDLYINFQPKFITAALLDAVEGEEYNIKLDTTKAIRISDANADQKHTFELIYAGDSRTEIALDPSFPDETKKDITSLRTTPTWLKINPESGVLYGIPSLITNMNDTNAKVTVLVTDEDGLRNVATFDLKIQIGNCKPAISVAPIMDCLVSGEQINEALTIWDRDLKRTGDKKEQLTLTVVRPLEGLTITPATIEGGIATDSVVVALKNSDPNGFKFDDNDLINGRLRVVIAVKDKKGASDTLEFFVRVSENVTFLSQITVTNHNGATKTLDWGTAPKATTGDNADLQGVGKLDANYCEIEIPPLPNEDVFDARWSIISTNGIYRNVFPTAKKQVNPSDVVEYRYRGIFQAGGVSGGASPLYPVVLSWNPKTVPAKDDNVKNPYGSVWKIIDGSSAGDYFSINMRDADSPYNKVSSDVIFKKVSDDLVQIIINDNRISSFHIIHDWYANDVIESNDNFVNSLVAISPNPITAESDNAKITFEVKKSGNVYIELFDVLGNKVADITDAYYNAGRYDINFNLRDIKGSKLSSGSYTVRMTTGMDVQRFNLIVLQ